MTFEEKKQKIIDEIIQFEDFVIQEFVLDEDDPASHATSNALKELQPDKPKCSTCYYYSPQYFKCRNINVAATTSGFKCMPNFGCIYHEEK